VVVSRIAEDKTEIAREDVELLFTLDFVRDAVLVLDAECAGPIGEQPSYPK
jgi:hypothetical protein